MIVKRNKDIMISPEHYNRIISKYMNFTRVLNDVNEIPVKVFEPLSGKVIEELKLIREISKELQMKKEEDMKKQAARDEEELIKKDDEEVAEVKKEE